MTTLPRNLCNKLFLRQMKQVTIAFCFLIATSFVSLALVALLGVAHNFLACLG